MADSPQSSAAYLAMIDRIEADIEKAHGEREPPKDPPAGRAGGDGDNDPMEARVAKLEAAVDHIQRDLGEIKTDIREVKRDARTDFRLLFGAIIAVALGLAGLMAKGFHWL